MKKIFLILLLALGSFAAWSQSGQNGTLELRNGSKISGTITKYSPQNGYAYTFYRIDNDNSTLYIPESEVLSVDTKRIMSSKKKSDNNKGLKKALGAIGIAMTGIVGATIHHLKKKKHDKEEPNNASNKKPKLKKLIFSE